MIIQNNLHKDNVLLADRHEFIDSVHQLPCFSIVNEVEDLACFDDPELQSWITLNNFIVFGTGGSSLCGQSLEALSENSKSITFVSNLDPTLLEKIFSEIDPYTTGFLFISKSGETLETIVQLILLMQKITPQKNADNFIRSRFVVITENKKSSLREIALKNNMICLDHPKDIGGRFSAFSIVGMLPAALMGIDPRRIRNGGKNILTNGLDAAKIGASFVARNATVGASQHVAFFYSDKLITFGEWLAQLYAESTGKSGHGITQLTARGAVAQHSQLQLYLDGPNDKCFTFFYERQNNSISLEERFIPPSFDYLKNKKITNIFEAQHDATISCIKKKTIEVREIKIDKLTPEILGEMFMHFMLEVTYVCEIFGINPFDQPSVEEGKIITRNLLAGLL